MIDTYQISSFQTTSIFDATSYMSGTIEDDRLFIDDNPLKQLFCFDQNEQVKPCIDFHLENDWEHSAVSGQSYVYRNLNLKSHSFVDEPMSNSIIPNIDTYDNEGKQSNFSQNLSHQIKYDSPSIDCGKADGFRLTQNVCCNHSDNATKNKQYQNISKMDCTSEINPNLSDQLIEVFLKETQCKINGGKRKDVLHKGSLRYIRKVFRHLFLNMFVHKRKRAQHSQAKHLEKTLNQFKNVWLDQNASFLKQEQTLIEFELIGRLINSKKYNLLSEKYMSKESKEIINFIALYDRCCVKYKQADCKNIVKSKFFKIMLKLYENVKSKGLFEKYEELNKAKFESNLQQIGVIIA